MSLYIYIFTIDAISSTGRIYLIAQETFQFLFLGRHLILHNIERHLEFLVPKN